MDWDNQSMDKPIYFTHAYDSRSGPAAMITLFGVLDAYLDLLKMPPFKRPSEVAYRPICILLFKTQVHNIWHNFNH